MVFASYFLKKFYKYVLFINLFLTLLFNFIEFFEKIIRIKHATVATILHFISLSLLPSFFETIPLSSWLATCLLLRELVQQNEWEALLILNINSKKIFHLFFASSLFLAFLTFICKEITFFDLTNKTEKFKLEKFKQYTKQKIIDKWLFIEESNTHNIQNSWNIFCYLGLLDLEKNIGQNIILIYMNSSFEIENILISKQFKLNRATKNILIANGSNLKPQKEDVINFDQKEICLPSFFSQIQLNTKIPNLLVLLENIIFSKNNIPFDIWNTIFYQFLKRLLFFIQIIIYPLLTFCFFLLLQKYRWFLIFLPYPLMILMNTSLDMVIQKGFSALIAIITYLVLTFFILILCKKLEKIY